MTYIRLSDKAIVSAFDIQMENKDVSFPVPPWDNSVVEPFGYAVAEYEPQPPCPVDCKLETGVPFESEGLWLIPWEIVPMTPEEIEAEKVAWRKTATCSPFQGRMALLNANLLTQAQAVVEGADQETKLAWEYAVIWERNSPMIESLGTAMQLTPDQIDDLFKAAQGISV